MTKLATPENSLKKMAETLLKGAKKESIPLTGQNDYNSCIKYICYNNLYDITSDMYKNIYVDVFNYLLDTRITKNGIPVLDPYILFSERLFNLNTKILTKLLDIFIEDAAVYSIYNSGDSFKNLFSCKSIIARADYYSNRGVNMCAIYKYRLSNLDLKGQFNSATKSLLSFFCQGLTSYPSNIQIKSLTYLITNGFPPYIIAFCMAENQSEYWFSTQVMDSIPLPVEISELYKPISESKVLDKDTKNSMAFNLAVFWLRKTLGLA